MVGTLFAYCLLLHLFPIVWKYFQMVYYNSKFANLQPRLYVIERNCPKVLRRQRYLYTGLQILHLRLDLLKFIFRAAETVAQVQVSYFCLACTLGEQLVHRHLALHVSRLLFNCRSRVAL